MKLIKKMNIKLYLKKDDVPKIEIKNKNEMIYNRNKYKINAYLNEINKVNNDFLDASIYNYCKKCRKSVNRYFCKSCNKNYAKNAMKNIIVLIIVLHRIYII